MPAIATRSRRAATVAAAAFSAVVYAVLLLGPTLFAAPGPFRTLRTAFWHDQLGYLSIVANAAGGDFSAQEPMTVTGINHYPRTYYVSVGAIAHAFSLDPVFAWNAVSAIFQLSAVILLAVTMSVLSRRWWVGMLAPLPFLTGTLSTFTNGTWRTPLESHAVLWGPYGVMFSSNAETAGLCVIVIVLSMLALAWARPAGRTTRIVVSVIAAILLGVLSGFQTYSFLTGVYLVSAILAMVFLWRARRWWWVATGVATIAVIIGGPLLADRVGQLPTLVFGLLFAAPGLILGIIRTRGMLAVYGAVLALVAAPPILWTVSGILGGDPFLTYRVASNHELGVIHKETLLATLPIALPILLLLVIALLRRDRIAAPALVGTTLCAILLVTNDVWGANAEPYRFWIDMVLLCGVVGALAAARLAGATPEEPVWRLPRRSMLAAVIVCAVVYAVSLADVVGFVRDPTMNATWDRTTSRERAIEDAARSAGAAEAGLIATDGCVDPRTTKVTSQQQIAYFYLGMAWPAEVDAVSMLVSGRLDGTLPGDAIADSNTRWLLTDSACADPLTLDGATVTSEESFPYDGGEIRLQAVRAE